MDHEQDRPDNLRTSTGKGGEAGNSSGIELDRLEGSSGGASAGQRIHCEEREADLVTTGADGAPALVAEAVVPRRTTGDKDREIFSNKIVWIGAFFLLLYVVSRYHGFLSRQTLGRTKNKPLTDIFSSIYKRVPR